MSWVLNTNTSYNPYKSFYMGKKTSEEIRTAAERAEALENQFYSQFGCSDFNQFLQKVRNIFSKSANDKKVFEGFLNINFKNKFQEQLKKYNDMQNIAVNIRIVQKPTAIKVDLPAVKEKLSVPFGAGNIELDLSSDKKSITMQVSPEYTGTASFTQLIKKDLNTYMKNSERYSSKNLLKENSGALDVAKERITEIIAQAVDPSQVSIKIGKGFTVKNPTIRFDTQTAMDYMHLKASEWRDDPRLNSIMTSICGWMKQEMLEKLNASAELKLAFKKTFDQADLENLFLTGLNKSGTVGAMGEFATNMWLEYINILLGKNNIHNTRVAEILGNQRINNEQLKTDVQFMNLFNIQVKNYDFRAIKNQSLESNLHPAEVDGIVGGNFAEYIANIYFNSSNGGKENAETQLKNVSEGLLHINIDEVLTGPSNPNKLCFFALGANLVPASAIYASVASGLSKSDVRITPDPSATVKGSDESFKEGHPMNAISMGYATPIKGGEHLFEEGPNLLGYYNDLISHAISIHVEFEVFSMIANGDYNIFGTGSWK